MQTALKEFQKRFSPELRNKMEMYLKIETAIYTKEREMESILRQKHDLFEEIKKSETATLTNSKEKAFQMITTGECGVFSPKLLDCLWNVRKKFEQVADQHHAE